MAAMPPMNVPQIPSMWTCIVRLRGCDWEECQHQQIARQRLQYHERNAGWHGPLESCLNNMAVGSNDPDEQGEAQQCRRKLPDGILLETARQPDRGDQQRGQNRLKSVYRGG